MTESVAGERATIVAIHLPPQLGYGESEPSMNEIALALATGEFAPWVRDVFSEKILVYVDTPDWNPRPVIEIGTMSDEDLSHYVEFLRSFENGRQIAEKHRREVEQLLAGNDDQPLPVASTRRKDLLIRLLELSQKNCFESRHEPNTR